MRSTLGIAFVLAAVLAADAQPLPAGLKITFAKNKVTATLDGVSVQLGTVTAKKLASAELSADGKTIKIKLDGVAPVEDEMGEVEEDEGVREYPLHVVEGRLANAAGMGLSLKKKYADAIPHFTRAMQKDPTLPVYVTNLLSAQSMSGKLDDADRVIATHGKRIAPWLAWRLVVDAELKALASRPSAKLGAAGTGKAKSKLAEQVAYSPLGYAAVELVTNASMGDGRGPVERGLVFVELTTGREVLTLPTERRQAAVTAKQRLVADKVLAMLDFEQVANGYHDASDGEATAPDGRKVSLKTNTINVPGKKPIALPAELPPIWGIAFVPKAVVFITREKSGDMFDIGLTSVATP